MKRYYDVINNRLLYIQEKATSEFWDRHWQKQPDIKQIYKNRNTSKLVLNTTKNYLNINSRVLEGGCGLGDKVHWLNQSGFNTIGIDFATNTIDLIKENFPEAKVEKGNLLDLKYEDESFDGYWSLGVIEHFFDGFEEIIKEARRILKPDKFLFITYPFMNKIREYKARKGKYPNFIDGQNIEENFYQFALDKDKTSKKICDLGFKLVKEKPYDASKGFKDEIYKFFLHKYIGYFINRSFNWLSGHIILQIYKKILK
ncbi:class I SAM-dependent methyltransferase [Candidatus Lokiarchaeum ossiferum]|uniref:class I SAM-dependent methyltransferase n=1 Tax=Candidatus Lokiarchaeum ossiferum TaxID=2951803 RepID=UPI00352CB818